ncbi:MAG TPA: hypothetical protein VGB59_12315 [Allosphingosinicella sp.]
MRWLAGLLLALAAPSAAAPKPEAVGAAFARIVELPGEVSLAAAVIDRREPSFFLTQKAERAMATGRPGETLSPADLVRKAHSDGPKGRVEGEQGAEGPAAVSKVWRLRTRNRRWVAMAIVWNGESARMGTLDSTAEPLLRLMRDF